jgi:hypothetical protein
MKKVKSPTGCVHVASSGDEKYGYTTLCNHRDYFRMYVHVTNDPVTCKRCIECMKVKAAEDKSYSGMKYSDYKTVIKIFDKKKELQVEFTTYRADIVEAILKAGFVIQAFEPGSTFKIEGGPNPNKNTAK